MATFFQSNWTTKIITKIKATHNRFKNGFISEQWIPVHFTMKGAKSNWPDFGIKA